MRDVYVYCDESRHNPGEGNAFLGIGSLWVPAESKERIHRRLRAVAEREGIGSELKWSKVSTWALRPYSQFLSVFFEEDDVRFRVILVEHAKLDYEKFHGGDPELGFYKFYFELLEKWIVPAERYIILLDHKVNARAGRYGDLERVLKRAAPSAEAIRRLSVIPNSGESYLAQMADLLTGAVTASWCGIAEGTPKDHLARWLAREIGRPSLRFESPSPARQKLNTFRIRLAPPGGQ